MRTKVKNFIVTKGFAPPLPDLSCSVSPYFVLILALALNFRRECLSRCSSQVVLSSEELTKTLDKKRKFTNEDYEKVFLSGFASLRLNLLCKLVKKLVNTHMGVLIV